MASRQSTVDPSSEEPFPQLRLHFTDDVQERYEIARPLLLGRLTSAAARARETDTHPQTVRRYVRRFERLGMQGLFGEDKAVPQGQTVSDSVRQEVIRLKTMHPPLHHREIANIIYATLGCRIDHKTVAAIIRAHPVAVQNRLPLPKFHDVEDSHTMRAEVIKLYYSGWNIQSVSGFLGVSRKHIYTLLRRFEEEQFAGLVARSHAPHHPRCKLYLPVLKKVAELQREYPLVGRFRLWGMLEQAGITHLAQRTISRAMAFNRLVYSELSRAAKKPLQEHPFKAKTWHQFWFIDHRYLVKIDGIQYYSLCILEGYSRAFLAGIVIATQARGPVLKLLYETVALWGAPAALVSDRGGAFISRDYECTCRRLGIEVCYIEAGQSWQNLIETHFNIQRRLGDYQFAQARTEAELQAAHLQFIETYNTMPHWAHQKRRKNRRTPQQVLAWVRGRLLSSRQLKQAFRELLWTRTTDRAGYVLVQNYYLYAERALSRQRVCLWLWDEMLRIDYRDELLASYPCVYAAEEHQIKRIGEPQLHENHYGQQQPQLLQLNPEQWQRVSQRVAQQRRRLWVNREQLPLPGIVGKK